MLFDGILRNWVEVWYNRPIHAVWPEEVMFFVALLISD